MLFALGAAGGVYASFVRYGNGCAHGSLLGLGAVLGAATAAIVVLARHPPPKWLTVLLLILALPILGAGLSISNDDWTAASGGCRHSHDAAIEDAISAGWLTLAGVVAFARGMSRRR